MGPPVHDSSAIPDESGRCMNTVRSSVLALLFLVLACPTVLIQVYCTPPIQVADEENHFLRALQVADGHLFGRKIEGNDAGGMLDPAAPIFAHNFDALKFAPERKLDNDTSEAAAALRWEEAPVAPAAFPNTAIYPFFLYLPASVGLAVGRALQLSVLDSFYMGRLATALTAVAVASLALAVCGRGRTLLFVILCFPMTLSLFASVSQDAMSIALGTFAAAAWSGYVSRGAAMPAAVRAVVALALGAVAAARIPLMPLYVLALLPTRPSMSGRFRPRLVDVAAAAAGLVPVAVGIYGAHAAKVPFRAGDGVSPIGQLRWMAVHPLEALTVAARTLGIDTLRHLRELVGVLGWLDTDLLLRRGRHADRCGFGGPGHRRPSEVRASRRGADLIGRSVRRLLPRLDARRSATRRGRAGSLLHPPRDNARRVASRLRADGRADGHQSCLDATRALRRRGVDRPLGGADHLDSSLLRMMSRSANRNWSPACRVSTGPNRAYPMIKTWARIRDTKPAEQLVPVGKRFDRWRARMRAARAA